MDFIRNYKGVGMRSKTEFNYRNSRVTSSTKGWASTQKTSTRNSDINVILRIAEAAFETNDAIMVTDTDANIIQVNNSFMDITGYSFEEVVGRNPRMMSSGRHDKYFYDEMWRQLQKTGQWAGEIWDRRKSGEVYPKWVRISAVKNEYAETTHYVAIFSDLSERKKSEEEIRNLAFYDPITKLPNRHLFLECFRTALSAATRLKSFGAILFIDLDRFKILNDTLGHHYGDLMLVEVAARLKAGVREMDAVARLGGDEFVVLIKNVSDDEEDASRKIGVIAEKIRESLSHPYSLNGHQHISSPSIGVNLYGSTETSVDELIQQADMAMYQAKSAGRNTIRFFDPVMQHNVATHAALENDFRNAIALKQLHLYYQMQVDNNHRTVGAEALLRWVHPERGLVMPNTFIPIAEESSLIVEIGDWVMDTACQQLALWAKSERTRDLTLSVNVSAKQFSIPGFVGKVAEVLKKHQVNPTRLKIELTESMMLENMAATVKKMHELKALGVSLSMDDFGIGYSSLSYLKQMPLDQLKIDQGFVQGITADGNDAVLVQTIIDLATNFHLHVIAEGVETEAQLTFLKHHDCMAYQGFLFGKAVPIDEFEGILNSPEQIIQ
ncbi:MAG: EAL domain-containing protein [Nitrosomonadales bacterium]|nr:EAL domain-containing protein [Nitrosomonadales bacterium]